MTLQTHFEQTGLSFHEMLMLILFTSGRIVFHFKITALVH